MYGYATSPATLAAAPDILLMTNTPDAAHPDTWARILWGTGGGLNFLGYSNPQVDTLLNQGAASTDPTASAKAYGQAGQLLVADYGILFLADTRCDGHAKESDEHRARPELPVGLAARNPGEVVMPKMILSRLAALAVILLALSAIVFALEALIPSDPVRAMVGASATREAVAAKRHELGFDKPLPVQYLKFLGRSCRGTSPSRCTPGGRS